MAVQPTSKVSDGRRRFQRQNGGKRAKKSKSRVNAKLLFGIDVSECRMPKDFGLCSNPNPSFDQSPGSPKSSFTAPCCTACAPFSPTSRWPSPPARRVCRRRKTSSDRPAGKLTTRKSPKPLKALKQRSRPIKMPNQPLAQLARAQAAMKIRVF